MSAFAFAPGHLILAVRVAGDTSTTREDVEQKVIDWLGSVLEVSPSRRSSEGEFVVGPANPVSVIPMLGMTDRELADREARLCQGAADHFLGFVPTGAPIGALVHLDWAGAVGEAPTRWAETLTGWEPIEGPETPDLAVVAQCRRDEPARPPIEPPSPIDDLDLPERPTIPNPLTIPWLWIGVGVAAVVALAQWQGSKLGRTRR